MTETISAGQVRELVLVDDLTRTQLVQYAGASGDYNPLHTDEVFARKVAGVPTVFGHGMLTMAMSGRVVSDWVGPQNVVSLGARFVSQVWPGDALTVTATVASVDEGRATIELVTRNQRDEVVLTGTAQVLAPASTGGA